MFVLDDCGDEFAEPEVGLNQFPELIVATSFEFLNHYFVYN